MNRYGARRRSRPAFRHRRQDGRARTDITASPLMFKGRRAWLLLATGAAERKGLEARRIESNGWLAGGVAHDYNNLLGVISGYGELLQKRVGGDPRLQKYARDIVRAAQRAARLTRQFLTFSHRPVFPQPILDLNGVVDEMRMMLARVLGEGFELVTVCGGDLGPVRADPGPMEHLLMNLAVNAREAMPDGGRLTLETANVEVGEAGVGEHPGLTRGRYVMLTVSDTGRGLAEGVLARIFEPGFTTKGEGKAGLGLTVVRDIVKMNGGQVRVQSELGRGSTFRVYLPRAEPPGVGRTILLVEEDTALRETIGECLEGWGYLVLPAREGVDAAEVCRRHPEPIHLLITDVVLPEGGGLALAARLRRAQPQLRVVFMSGYPAGALAGHGLPARDVAFLQKPFSIAELAEKVGEVLDTEG